MPVQGVQIVQRCTTTLSQTTSLPDGKGRTLSRIAIKGSQASYSVSFCLLVKKIRAARKQRRKLQNDVALQHSSDTKKSKSDSGRKSLSKLMNIFKWNNTTPCFGHLSPTQRWQPSDCQEEQYTLQLPLLLFFHFITWQYKTSVFKRGTEQYFLGIKAHAGKCNASMAFVDANLSIFKNTVFHAKGRFCFTAAVICMWSAMQLELTHATAFPYQPLFSGLRMVPYSQCSPLFPFCSTHFWHQTGLSSHQLSTPERQEGKCYWSLQSDVQSRRQWHPISKYKQLHMAASYAVFKV